MAAPEDLAALRARHTVKPPALPFAKALAGLAQTPGTPAYDEAALAFLTWRFSPLAQGVVDPQQSYAAELARIADRAEQVSAPVRKRFADTLLFNLTSSQDYRLLAPLILAWVPAADLLERLLNTLRSNNWLHVLNALALPYQVLGRTADYDFTQASRADLFDLVLSIGSIKNAPELVSTTAKRFRFPTRTEA